MHLTSRRFDADAAVRGGGPAGFAGAPAAAVCAEKQHCAGGEFCANGADTAGIRGGRAPAGM